MAAMAMMAMMAVLDTGARGIQQQQDGLRRGEPAAGGRRCSEAEGE